MRWIVLCLILVSSLAGAQSLPDAPLPQPAPKQSIWKKQWDYNRPQRTYAETFKNPWFYGMSLGLIGSNLADLAVQQSAFNNGCVDGNGKRPGWLEQGGQDLAADGAVITMAFFLKRAHIKVIPEAMLGYGIQLHVRSAIHGYGQTCR